MQAKIKNHSIMTKTDKPKKSLLFPVILLLIAVIGIGGILIYEKQESEFNEMTSPKYFPKIDSKEKTDKGATKIKPQKKKEKSKTK